MLGGAFEVASAAPDDVILVVVAALGLGYVVCGIVDVVRSPGSRAARLPLDVLERVGTVDDGDPIPLDLFGAFISQRATIKRSK